MSIMGAVPAGVTTKVASHVERRVKSEFTENGKAARLKSVRFVPSTKVELGEDACQVLANVVLQVMRTGGDLGRLESVDSVVTVQQKTTGQVLHTVTIRALDWMKAGCA